MSSPGRASADENASPATPPPLELDERDEEGSGTPTGHEKSVSVSDQPTSPSQIPPPPPVNSLTGMGPAFVMPVGSQFQPLTQPPSSDNMAGAAPAGYCLIGYMPHPDDPNGAPQPIFMPMNVMMGPGGPAMPVPMGMGMGFGGMLYGYPGMYPKPVKRRQVKNACTNCQKACKRCGEDRPCPRCVKYGLQGECTDSVRKERKRGVKRGSYKKRMGEDEDQLASEYGGEFGQYYPGFPEGKVPPGWSENGEGSSSGAAAANNMYAQQMFFNHGYPYGVPGFPQPDASSPDADTKIPPATAGEEAEDTPKKEPGSEKGSARRRQASKEATPETTPVSSPTKKTPARRGRRKSAK